MTEEIYKVLKMLEEKKITADEAAKLIDAINLKKSEADWIDLNQSSPHEQSDSEFANSQSAQKPNWLFILVQKGGKKNINVRIPINLARLALKFIPKRAQAHIKEELGDDFDLSQLSQLIDNLPPGEDLVNIYDEDEDETIRIFLR